MEKFVGEVCWRSFLEKFVGDSGDGGDFLGYDRIG